MNLFKARSKSTIAERALLNIYSVVFSFLFECVLLIFVAVFVIGIVYIFLHGDQC